jgi:transcriptional regulator with PAS, ATPase and Fis domain
VSKVLCSWMGHHDIAAAKANGSDGVGPLATGLSFDTFDRAVILYNYPANVAGPCMDWLERRAECPIQFVPVQVVSPVHHETIYLGVLEALNAHVDRKLDQLTFHLSPGTPAMHSVWLLLAKAKYPARLIQSSKHAGCQEADVPFDISMELTELLRNPDAALSEYAGSRTRRNAFRDVTYKSSQMRNLVDLAHRSAQRDVSVLLLGETGTGKEVFAKAIHGASARSRGPFVPVNCGAIPENLVESELFGHERGAFTGAQGSRKGHFREAHGGTLFLDEVGDLPTATQVKLLRVLQEREVVPVGGTAPISVDVRVIAATHRRLQESVREGTFRQDLFYRLAVAVLEIPALRERKGDVGILIEVLLQEINEDQARMAGYEPKSITPGAKQRLLNHTWPGNVRELRNTLLRAAVFSKGDKIRKDEVVLFPALVAEDDRVKGRPLGDGFSVPDLLAEVEWQYIQRGMEETGGRKSEAARLLGYRTYQALDYRMQALKKKYSE